MEALDVWKSRIPLVVAVALMATATASEACTPGATMSCSIPGCPIAKKECADAPPPSYWYPCECLDYIYQVTEWTGHTAHVPGPHINISRSSLAGKVLIDYGIDPVAFECHLGGGIDIDGHPHVGIDCDLITITESDLQKIWSDIRADWSYMTSNYQDVVMTWSGQHWCIMAQYDGGTANCGAGTDDWPSPY